jgi:hypothetical protein
MLSRVPDLSPERRRETLADLRASLSAGHPGATPEAFTPASERLVRSGLSELDNALGGGFPRGVIVTLEGPQGSGRSSVLGRLLATATAGGGLAALIEAPAGPDGALYPPSLAAAGVDLARLLVVPVCDTPGVARAVDVVLRAAAFGVIAIPAVALPATAWTRLAGLTHRTGALLIALGETASDELRYFASVRVRLQPQRVRWAGGSGPFCALAESDVTATILKHKRAAPGKIARIACTTFECAGPPLVALRERVLEAPSMQRFVRRTVVAV